MTRTNPGNVAVARFTAVSRDLGGTAHTRGAPQALRVDPGVDSQNATGGIAKLCKHY